MGEGTSLVNLGELSKPATVLIQKVSAAVGGLFKPYQIRRLAKAEAEAALIHAESEIQVTELHRRAVHRFINEEAQKQANMEAITEGALPLLETQANPDQLEEDWVANFFDKCRIVSDVEMQQLWSKVLAGEASAPGTYSKRTVNFLGSLDKDDASLFTRLCGFAWILAGVVPLVYDVEDEIYTGAGISFASLKHLDDVGLISFDNLAGYRQWGFPKHVTFFYYGTPTLIEFPAKEKNGLNIGRILLTKTGMQLAPICGSKSVDGFREYVLSRWLKEGLVLSSPLPAKAEAEAISSRR